MKVVVSTVIIIAVLAGAGTGIIYYGANAQVEPTDRYFKKYFCESESALLDDVNYLNNEQVSYSTSGCPEVNKVIHRWNELSLASQNLITNRLSLQGYTDITSEVSQNGRAN